MSNNRLLYTICSVLFALMLYGQQPGKKEELQKKSAALRQEIAELNKELAVNRKESQTSILYITNLNKKIETRASLITNTKKESRILDDEIYLSQLQINKLRRELKELRENYADVLIRSYKNKSVQNKILFILSSDNISQAFRRIKYLQKYSEYQDQKIAEINDKQTEILRTIEAREKSKKDKLNILAQQQVQMQELNSERVEKQVIVEKYMKNQGDLVVRIKEKQAQKQALDRQVQGIIAEEIRIVKAKEAEEKRQAAEAERLRRKTQEEERAKRALEAQLAAEKLAAEKAAEAREAARKAMEAQAAADKEKDNFAVRKAEETRRAAEKAAAEKAAAEKLALKKEEEAKIAERKAEEKRKSIGVDSTPTASASESLSRSFEANRNSLPWPVSGTIIIGFGSTPHPVLPGITVDNKGVEIAASSGSSAKAVFNGTVSRIIVVPGGGKAVLLNHGDYFTLYANLSSVSVSVGNTVKTGQVVGKIYSDDDKNTILNFQVWKGTTPQNPSNWISGM